MGISCGAVLIKYILFAFNFLWLILGGVVIYLGVTIASFSGDIQTIVDTNMKAGALSVMVTGVIIFLVAFLGCCGAIKENSCMLSTYGGLILIVIVVQCVGIYFAFKNKTDIEKKIKESIDSKFIKFHLGDKELNRAIQEIQKFFKCCGTSGPGVYSDDRIPISCCGGTDFGGDSDQTCKRPEVKYNDGCTEKVYNSLTKYLGGLAGVAIALVLIQLLIVMSACCLSREFKN